MYNIAVKRDYFIDYAKSLLIFIVIIGHVLYVYIPNDWPFDLNVSYNSIIVTIEKIIYSFHISAFFAISGYLSKYSMDKYDLFTFIKKRALRLLVPFIFFKYALWQPLNLWINPKLYGEFGTNFLKDYLLDSSFGHLWFIFCLAVLQIFGYFVYRYWGKNKIFSALIIPCLLFAAFFSVQLTSWMPFMNGTANNLLYYSLYYIIGVKLNCYLQKRKEISVNKKYCVLAGLSALFISYINSFVDNHYFGVLTRIYVTFIYLLIFYTIFKNYTAESKTVKMINNLSMPLYLWHQLYVFIFLKLWTSNFTGIYIVGCFVFAVIASFASTALFSILKLNVLDGGVSIYKNRVNDKK